MVQYLMVGSHHSDITVVVVVRVEGGSELGVVAFVGWLIALLCIVRGLPDHLGRGQVWTSTLADHYKFDKNSFSGSMLKISWIGNDLRSSFRLGYSVEGPQIKEVTESELIILLTPLPSNGRFLDKGLYNGNIVELQTRQPTLETGDGNI